MKSEWYPRLIRALCEQAGIEDWKTVAEIQQIEAKGFIVAFFIETESSDALAVYVELTHKAVGADIGLLQQLLESNMIVGGAPGFFTLVPLRGTVGYRTSISRADTISGEDLMSRILHLVSTATTRFYDVTTRAARLSQPKKVTSPFLYRKFK